MLQLKEIKKDYMTGDQPVHALKGIDLGFRESEFVAILGHSGCGKTTLLNIIGGLDKYTSGDLVINGKSTKNFSDADWDAYRNHSIGFVFQSYNLIPHQSVLANVELALTISGVGKAERRRRAVEALEKVGLGDQLNKKPNQMSGGQMQRVAIARALVNDPDILLADEPTGALDSETSVQIMDILKEISASRLIIMVTHNPELAENYASRIIRIKDGLITDDSDPYAPEGEEARDTGKKQRRTSMSFLTALSLSLNNLMTKKTRTVLTAFAGSIGIIGIALIMSLSNGIQNYIDKVQADTLSSYPITIQAESVDMTNMMTSLMGVRSQAEGGAHDKDAVYSSTVMYDMMNSMISADKQTNNLKPFKEYIEDENSEIAQYISSVQYTYDLDMNLYAEDVEGNIAKTDVVQLMQTAMSSMYGGDYSSFFSTYGSYYSVIDIWQEMLPGENGEYINPFLKKQYDVLYGKWPESYDEAVLIVNENNEISDLVLYALGLKSTSSIADDMQSFVSQETVEAKVESWSDEEICDMSFRYIFPADMYQYDEEEEKYINLGEEELGLKTLFNNGLELKIVGVIRQNEDAVSGMMTGAIGYTHAFIEHIAKEAEQKALVKKQLDSGDINILSGLKFLDTEDEALTKDRKQQAAREYIEQADDATIAELYIKFMCHPSDDYVKEMVDEQLEGTTREDIEKQILEMYPEYASMLEQMDDDMLFDYIGKMAGDQVREQYAAEMEKLYRELSDEELVEDFGLLVLEDEDYLWIYNNAMPPVYSEINYKETLKKLGYVDLNTPSVINIYASSFEDKDNISTAIKNYNNAVSKEDEITYTDIVALLMSSITTIINVISYVLIAFVAISLVVSSIMIGIITYISVLERTKEIGILRAIGASNRDVSHVFNAETVIIGFTAGAIGIILTLLLNIPINMIVHDLTGIMSLNSALPAAGGIGLVLISMILTFIAGLIPSGIAARKDPVEALRTE
ncbi:MAG: ATP-binding cassette domain-containing protein [Oscillospiraceae bacterium]|nr:ATP-binding cassette domain-containing protein [Oscillospiraceae bacterium]